MHAKLSRRTILKGLGTAIALPYLDAMLPLSATAASPKSYPKRMAFLYVPNGIHMQDWKPEVTGTAFELTPTLKGLAPFKSHLNVLTGLTCDKARANGDGPGDHARSLAAFLTGCQARKTARRRHPRRRLGRSGRRRRRSATRTRFPSLEIGCEGGTEPATAIRAIAAPTRRTSPGDGETTPHGQGDRPAGWSSSGCSGRDPDENAASSREARKVPQEHARLRAAKTPSASKPDSGTPDKRKLDEYLTAVREIEHADRRWPSSTADRELATSIAEPAGIPRGLRRAHAPDVRPDGRWRSRAISTRVGTFVFANEGSNRSYPFIGVPEGHHDLSHHGNDTKKQAKISQDQPIPHRAIRLLPGEAEEHPRKATARCSTTG